MNVKNTPGLIAALIFSASALLAKPLAGPNGGRILTDAAPHAEFFVDANRHAVVSFYDADLKPLTLTGQVVSATAEAPAGKVKMKFAAKDGALVSAAPLPEGDGYRVVVQIRASASARFSNYRVAFHDEDCEGCDRAEYACICEDESGGHGGHAH